MDLARETNLRADEYPLGMRNALACELLRQAVYWAILARLELESDAPRRSSEGATKAPGELWSKIDPRVLLAAARDDARKLEQLRLYFTASPGTAQLGEAESTQLVGTLEEFNQRLLEPATKRVKRLQRVWLLRMAAVGVVAVALIGAAFALQAFAERRELSHDLTAAATWQASSAYYDPAHSCKSPQQECAESPDFFFHTLEERNPWIVFDLGAPRRISKLIVENRRDCCKERAVPLVVQVSSDKRHWTTVATRVKPFSVWREELTPVDARWVKLFARRKTLLHLARVRLLP